jgi:hypothetical protein
MFEINVLFVLLLSWSMQTLTLDSNWCYVAWRGLYFFYICLLCLFLHCLFNCTSYPQHPFVTIVICELVKQDIIEKMSHDAKRFQNRFYKGSLTNPKLNPFLYLWCYNTLTMCSKLSVDTIIDMILWWHCNTMFGSKHYFTMPSQHHLMIISTFNFEHIVKVL